jgi:hypothetical protein
MLKINKHKKRMVADAVAVEPVSASKFPANKSGKTLPSCYAALTGDTDRVVTRTGTGTLSEVKRSIAIETRGFGSKAIQQ